MENFVPKKPEKETISVRISSEVIQELERKAAATGISRNELINQCIVFALKHIDTASEKENE